MNLKSVSQQVVQTVSDSASGLSKFAKLERNLAAVCMFVPLILIIFDSGAVRDSISAYYDMAEAQYFYVPLTMGAMLFIINGVVKHQHSYNTILGVALMGVVLFDHDGQYSKIIHFLSAGVFFLGSAFVILKYSSKKELWFKCVLVAIIVGALGAWVLGFISLFWAEWVSLIIIALHYILESMGRID